MAKLYFKYGAMCSSKSAEALMCRFNYMQKGMNVLLMKPATDTRTSSTEVVSRIGLKAPCRTFSSNENLMDIFCAENEKTAEDEKTAKNEKTGNKTAENENSAKNEKTTETKSHKVDVVIVDEAQFCTKRQVEQLREIAEIVPVLCYGLKTNFKTELFDGSKRLLELADSIREVKSVCECGKKAIFNGRFVKNLLVTDGAEIEIGGDDKYRGLCYTCYQKEKRKANAYNKIIKYLKIFKDLESAGEFSSDTAADNVILQERHIIYDEDVQSFVEDFKEFQVKHPEKLLQLDDNIEALRKVVIKDKSFEYVLNLISFVLKIEKQKPGLLKALVEDGTLLKWLRHLKKCVNEIVE